MLMSPGRAVPCIPWELLACAEAPQGCPHRWFLFWNSPSCSPGYQRLHVGPALLQRRPVTEPTLSYTQPTSPHRGGQTRSTWTASYTRQSDGTPVGLILGEAQPWAVCLVYASRCLKSGGQLSPSFQIRRVTSWYGRSEVKITGCTG